MTKTMAICVILTLLLATGAALASETDWSIYMRADDGSHPDTAIRMGTTSGTPSSTTYQPAPLATMYAAIRNSGFGSDYLSTDLKSQITTPETRSWDIEAWGNPGVNGRLNFWSTSSLTPPDTINGLGYSYDIEVITDPTGKYAAGTVFQFSPGATGSATQPHIQLNWSSFNYHGEHIQLRLTAQPVPEPSGLLALTCGLFGSLSIAIRRKR